jgi:hypothetical protein
VVWLGSGAAAGVTGRVFNIRGGHLSVLEGWREGPTAEKDGRWDSAELGPVVEALVAESAGNAVGPGRPPAAAQSGAAG